MSEPDIKESHALIDCPHCGKPIRVRARTLANQTVEQVFEERRKASFISDLMDKVFGSTQHRRR